MMYTKLLNSNIILPVIMKFGTSMLFYTFVKSRQMPQNRHKICKRMYIKYMHTDRTSPAFFVS